MEIRPETPGDAAAIGEITTAAFRTAAHSSGTEAAIVERLRADRALVLSLVAVEGDEIVGHVAASPVTVDGQAGWMGIGPISVAPDRQRRGLGSALMVAVLAELREGGAKGAVLVGDPAYYERFGFAAQTGLAVRGVPPAYVLALPFGQDAPEGIVAFHPAFGVN